jgi:hypothetical protein
VFDEQFYPPLGLNKKDLNPAIDSFYSVVYPKLSSLTSIRHDAMDLVNFALQAGMRVVIATNPVFPRTAIEQKLEWAGLDPSSHAFSLITTFESIHFTKPNPAYFAEILATLGWPSDDVVMVGNSLEDDIVPAEVLGITAILIPELNEQSGVTDARFQEVYNWFKHSTSPAKLSSLGPAGLCAILRSTPAAASSLLQSFELGNQRPNPSEWSGIELLGHLTDLDVEVFLPRFKKIAEEHSPFLPGIQTDNWVSARNYNARTLTAALDAFFTARMPLLAYLENLPTQTWSQPARHAIFGPTTLLEQVAFAAQHDQTHIQQLLETIQQLSS